MRNTLLVSILSISTLGGVYAQDQTEIVWQENFERWENGLPVDWERNHEEVSLEATEEGHSGKALWLRGHGVDEVLIYDATHIRHLTEDQWYTLSTWVYRPKGSSLTALLYVEGHGEPEEVPYNEFYLPVPDLGYVPPAEEPPHKWQTDPAEGVNWDEMQPNPADNPPTGPPTAEDGTIPQVDGPQNLDLPEISPTEADATAEITYLASTDDLSMGKWVRIERRFQAKRSGPTRIGWKTMAADGASGAGIFIDDMQLAKTSSGCNTGDQFLSFNIDGKFSDTTIACSNNIPTQLLFNGLYTSPIIGKGKYEWTVYKDGVAIHTATQELECDPSYGGCPWVEYIQTLPISTGTYKVRLKGKKKFLLWWYVDVFDICSDEITVTMPENASANLSINNNFSNQVSVCEFDPIIVDASSSDCETSWFLSLQAADGNWSGVGTEYTRWFSGQAPANLDLRLAAAILWNVTIDPDTRWRVKIAVGTPYDSKTRFLTVKNCGFTDSWTSVGNPQTDLSNQDGKIYVGDFNGDGDDEMLQVTGSVMDMLEYRNGNWVTLWTNGGSTNQAIYPYRNRLEVGDFDGDGKDEVLGIASWMTMFHFDNGQWNWGWSDYGDPNASGGLYPYRYNVKVGDFDGDSKDELFGVASWMTMFNFDGGQWNWGWSDDGDPTKSGGLFPYKSNLRVGDFDNDGRDDLLGLASWATWFSFNNGWTWKTSTSGGPLAGWALPFSNQDKLITGDVDNLDGKSELLMFDRGPGAGRMQTADLNGANQFARRYYNQNSGMFFLTPLYQSGCVTDYFRVKPIAGQPDQVMMHLRCGLPLSSAALNLYAMHKIAQPNANYRMDNESVFSAEMEGMVYPNPATDVLSVQLPKGSEDASWQIAITNLQGQTVWKGQAQGQVSVEVKDYPRGLYLLKATQGKEQWDKRIILQ